MAMAIGVALVAAALTAYAIRCRVQRRADAARDHAVRELRHHEELLRLFVEHSPVALAMLDRDFNYLMTSRRWITDYRLEGEALIGRSHFDVFPHIPAEWHERHRRSLEGGVERSELDRFVHADGSEEWIRGEVRPWRNAQGEIGGILIFSEFITERVEAEAARCESESRFREIAENIKDVFWVAPPDRVETFYVSPAYETVWGRPVSSLFANPKSWLELVHPGDRERVARASREDQASGRYDITYRIVRDDGSVRWIHDRAYPIRNEAGEVIRIVGLAEDVTEAQELAERLRQSQKMEAIGVLAGGVAHDFNNILTAMAMEVALATAPDATEGDARETLQQVGLGIERAAALTRQLLLFGRRRVMQARPVDLNEVVTSISRMLQRIIGEDVRLDVSLANGSSRTVADAGMMEQVVMNLAVNARDAMPGGGTLRLATEVVMLSERRARELEMTPGRCLCLRVTDSGSGIPADVLPHIFEPFFTTKGVGQGTGLGLATVFGIVKQHRGAINVKSTPGNGAEFEIFLPALDESPARVDGDTESLMDAHRGGTETILLVEDERAVRDVARRLLQRAGYRVLDAVSPSAASELWDRHRDEIDLLLTDLVMPGGEGGWHLADRLQATVPRLPVVFMSGYSPDAERMRLDSRGTRRFVAKPFSTTELLSVVRTSLDAS